MIKNLFLTKTRPSKYLFYYKLYKNIKLLEPIESLVDFACGEMRILSKITPAYYLGVDVLDNRIKKGLKTFPNANGIVSKIQDFNTKEKFQVVVCIQAIGINSWFETDQSFEIVKKLVKTTKVNGHLLFNIGPFLVNKDKAIVEKIENLLNKNFVEVDRFIYGRWSNRYPKIISILLFYIMLLFPFFRCKSDHKWIYYNCKNSNKF